VHALPSLHEVGQAPAAPLAIAMSQVSWAAVSTTPLPHVAEQSGSVVAVQPDGQQPSETAAHAVTTVVWQWALQSRALPASAMPTQADGDTGQ
jgi:hypothetical protein